MQTCYYVHMHNHTFPSVTTLAVLSWHSAANVHTLPETRFWGLLNSRGFNFEGKVPLFNVLL